MSEPDQFMNDPVGWDHWLQLDEASWARWALVTTPQWATNPMHSGPDTNIWNPQTAVADHVPGGTVANECDTVHNLNALELGVRPVEEHVELSEASSRFSLTKKFVYLGTTCASCGGPLDRSEQDLGVEEPTLSCAQYNDIVDHPPLSCDVPTCGLKFGDLRALKKHSREKEHGSFQCAVPTCRMPLTATPYWSTKHFRDCHEDIKLQCAKCFGAFETYEALDIHCRFAQHACYVCKYPDCGSEALRLKDLNRHQLIHKTSVPRHPCPHCRE
ncbi:hypothetical protein EG329_001192 [Mollisiaceae sp. DMI_Dod_QoI]|nr:hypothetical protein EG329_001192 [Helotiales sp. DMI_Dod_QoI]